MRPLEELIFFQTIEVLLVIIRIFAIIYFFRETLRYYRFQGEQKDPYTILTFLFLALSIILLFFNLKFYFRVTKWNFIKAKT